MLIHKFINSISRSDLSNFKTLKQLHRLLNNIHYSPELHKKLLLHGCFFNETHVNKSTRIVLDGEQNLTSCKPLFYD